MSVSEDLTNFDLIEGHKENIQSLPGGRSAKALASTFAPTNLRSSGTTPGNTRNLNDAIREEYEIELSTIADSDDPLDIYDRYVKWTMGAYPSAQATPESQLRPLLERATKAFQSANHYKNDPRYLKLWMNYIRLFSDAPRETFAYLARHTIGEGLALFYEEFAAWLECAGRWNQADEVYKLGIERDARPAERLIRKFAEFQHRFESRVQNGDEPSSPALPTVRPALAAKMDPFAQSTPQSADPQAPRPTPATGRVSISRQSKDKLAVFSDANVTPSSTQMIGGDAARGWDSIGTISERRKENVIEAKPWTGETLKTGKRPAGPPKMTIFKDGSSLQDSNIKPMGTTKHADQQQVTIPQSGKIERRFVDLTLVYPKDDSSVEMSFEELRAESRGWLDRDWAAQGPQRPPREALSVPDKTEEPLIDFDEPPAAEGDAVLRDEAEARSSPEIQFDNTIAGDLSREGKISRPKKMRIKEVKGETQTVKTNLASPTGPKMRRKNSADPTMTLHTKAATDDIIDIFNQPLRNVDSMAGPAESDGETDYDDDDYTSAGESTGTGRISGTTSEFGDTEAEVKGPSTTEESMPGSASPWSDFTASKHVPKYGTDHPEREHAIIEMGDHAFAVLDNSAPLGDSTTGIDELVVLEDDVATINEDTENFDIVMPVSPEPREKLPTRYVPIPPEDYEPPLKMARDLSLIAQNKLPFMTPIAEKTETSLGAMSIREDKDYFNSKTPCRNELKGHAITEVDEELMISPLNEIVNEARPARVQKLKITQGKVDLNAAREVSIGPVIKDTQCNPVDDTIRNTILESLSPSLSTYSRYHNHRPQTFNRGPEIRKFIKAISKSKNSSDKTTTSISLPPELRFSATSSMIHRIKRELGKGAFAPVYLAEESGGTDSPSNDLIAIKCEHPPTSWEFFIMSALHDRLPPSHRASQSLLRPHALHLFADEGYLLEAYLDQGTLLDLVNLAKSDPTSGQTTLDESVAMFFTVELLRTVEAMHHVGILHGDLKADNCLVRLSTPPGGRDERWDGKYTADGSNGWSSKGLCLIDFGRGIDMRAFRPDVQFVADWKTSKQDCVEMREMRPWVWQVDYWGVAGVIHSLLFGKYVEDVAADEKDAVGNKGKRYRIREGLKRYWQTELWGGLFDLLLNPAMHVATEEGQKMPCTLGLKACREGMEHWLAGEGGRRNGGLKVNLTKLEDRIRERKPR